MTIRVLNYRRTLSPLLYQITVFPVLFLLKPQRSLSPPSALVNSRLNEPSSPTSGYADDHVSTIEGSPKTHNQAVNRPPYLPPNSVSMWIHNQQSQQQRSQESEQSQYQETSNPSFPGSPPAHRQDDGSSLQSGRLGNRANVSNGDWSPNGRLTSPPPGPGGSPQRLAKGIISPAEPSSIMRRISDKGGGSLPGSPTRGGRRYGRTDELVGSLNSQAHLNSTEGRGWTIAYRAIAYCAAGVTTSPSFQCRSCCRGVELVRSCSGGLDSSLPRHSSHPLIGHSSAHKSWL